MDAHSAAGSSSSSSNQPPIPAEVEGGSQSAPAVLSGWGPAGHPAEPMDTASDDDKNKQQQPPPPAYASEGQERRANSLAAIKLICHSSVFSPHLEALLALCDAQGNTPFMAAIAARAYPAALALLDAAERVAQESSDDKDTQRKTLMSMIFPENSSADSNPLHVV